jgi:hypothetical protein
MNTPTVTIGIDILIAYFRDRHPDDERPNAVLAKRVFSIAIQFPGTKKLGKKKSVLRGHAGLPGTSEQLEVSLECLAKLFEQANSGLINKGE